MSRSPASIYKLILIMLIAMLFSKSILNIFTNPPWQNADEIMYLEAALVTGNNFPHLLNRMGDSDPALQKELIKCASNHSFFYRLRIPEPAPLPETFSTTVFLRDAPSKLGREPLFFLFTGVPAALFTSGLLEALYLARILCLVMAVLSLILLSYTLIRNLDWNWPETLAVLALFICQPAFWQLAAGVNMESWKLFAVSLGFFLLTSPRTRNLSIRSAGLIITWLLLITALRWTLLPLAFVMVGAHIISLRRQIQLQKKWLYIFGATGVLIPLSSVLLFMDKKLLSHELTHAISGLAASLGNPEKLFSICKILSKTFWCGFSWLQIPVTGLTLGLCYVATILLMAGILVYFLSALFSSQYRRSNPEAMIACSSMAIVLILIFIRALSNEPAIQGRYFFPVIPFIFISAVKGTIQIGKKLPGFNMRIVICLMLFFLFFDLHSNVQVWLRYQHSGYNELKDPVKSMKSLCWINSDKLITLLEPGSEISQSFFSKGWYPPEPGRNTRWMLNHGEVLLPLMTKQDMYIRIDFNTFSPDQKVIRNATVALNGSPLGTFKIEPADSQLLCFAPADQWIDDINSLSISVDGELSPFDLGLSNDKRYLTIALHRVLIYPSSTVNPEQINPIEASGWFIRKGFTEIIRLNEKDVISAYRINHGDHILARLSDGNYNRIWWNSPDDDKLLQSVKLQSVEYFESLSSTMVSIYWACRASISNLPGILSDVYLHIFCLLFWISSVLISILTLVTILIHTSA